MFSSFKFCMRYLRNLKLENTKITESNRLTLKYVQIFILIFISTGYVHVYANLLLLFLFYCYGFSPVT